MPFQFQAREPLVQQSGTLVLLHGLGADEFDLLGLAEYLPPSLRVVCPRAPLMSPWGGNSWFGIDIQNGQLAIDEGEARSSLELLVEFVATQGDEILIGGFSQGAMMSVGLLLKNSGLVAGTIQLSGSWLPCFQPRSLSPQPVFAAHGQLDPVVPFELGRDSAAKLGELGCDVSFNSYRMGHEISPECLSDLVIWTHNWLLNRDNSPELA